MHDLISMLFLASDVPSGGAPDWLWPTLVGAALAAAGAGLGFALKASNNVGSLVTRLTAMEEELEKPRPTIERVASIEDEIKKRASTERLDGVMRELEIKHNAFTQSTDAKLDALTKSVDLKASSESMRHVENSINEIKGMLRELLNRAAQDARDAHSAHGARTPRGGDGGT